VYDIALGPWQFLANVILMKSVIALKILYHTTVLRLSNFQKIYILLLDNLPKPISASSVNDICRCTLDNSTFMLVVNLNLLPLGCFFKISID
jgi:hypothetical protein